MSSFMDPKDAFVALNAAVRMNRASATEEVEVTLYDANSEDGKDAILTITGKDFAVTRRDAQGFEIEKAKVAVEGKYKTSWLFSLD